MWLRQDVYRRMLVSLCFMRSWRKSCSSKMTNSICIRQCWLEQPARSHTTFFRHLRMWLSRGCSCARTWRRPSAFRMSWGMKAWWASIDRTRWRSWWMYRLWAWLCVLMRIWRRFLSRGRSPTPIFGISYAQVWLEASQASRQIRWTSSKLDYRLRRSSPPARG